VGKVGAYIGCEIRVHQRLHMICQIGRQPVDLPMQVIQRGAILLCNG
jgi:hypothetical protein